MILPAIIGALPFIYQGAVGFGQQQAGRMGLRNLRRPQYQIPSAQQSALAIARSAYADPRMPGEATAYSRIGQQMANFANTAQDNQNVGAGLVQAMAATNEANRDLAAQSAQFQLADQQNLQAQLGTYGQYQDTQWQLNKFAPYAQKYNEYREQVGAGEQNLMGAITGLSNIGMTMIGDLNLSMRARRQDRRMNKMYKAQLAAQQGTKQASKKAVQKANTAAQNNLANAQQQQALAPGATTPGVTTPASIAVNPLTTKQVVAARTAATTKPLPNPKGTSRSSISGSPITIQDFSANYTPDKLGSQQIKVNAGGQDIEADLSTGRLKYTVAGKTTIGTIEDLFKQDPVAFEALINQLNSMINK